MEVYESNQRSNTRKSQEKNNGKINSRYKSPTPRHFPSPNTTTRTSTPTPPVSKRAVSTGRQPPPRPATPVHDTSIYTDLRKPSGSSKLAESLWPSRMRSLNVAFQSNSFSMPISKKEKPPPQAVHDRTLKSSSNVATPTVRKATPERKRSPLKGKNTLDQSENSKPLDSFHHPRLVDQHRWPSRTRSNVVTKTIELPEKSTHSPQRISNLETLPNKSNSQLSRGVSPSRTRSLTSRGVSPNHIRPASPNHARPASPSRQLCNSNSVSVLSFIADIKKGKKVANRIEDAHHLRLLYNRQVQWRFVNAISEASLNSQKITAEKSLINAQRTTLKLQDSVAAKRINICQLKLQLKLYLALNQQINFLNQWSTIEREHNFAVHGAIEDLQASTLRLPVTGCATANIQTLKSAVYSAIQVMQTIGSSLQTTFSRPEGTNWLVSELATVTAQEKALLDECEALLASASSLQVEEYSLRTNLVQLKQD